ncbi:hypothetical protein [Streptomyces sp. MB09-02B]|uniref:hypothetical protein n=1 Tax=Streptomyces sp. MB09-02B TaxID=3028667 RepID=UPI0029BB047A|nr:hypothetical protein [Streptomyces sp. MB09-02B]MDX3639983.1 hypothetical protein [Streptomyces sp. MB09-02B]
MSMLQRVPNARRTVGARTPRRQEQHANVNPQGVAGGSHGGGGRCGGTAAGRAGSCRDGVTANFAFIYVAAAEGKANQITVSVSGGHIVIADEGDTVTAGTGCTQRTPNSVICAAGVRALSIDTGDLDDTVTLETTRTRAYLYGKEGDDTFDARSSDVRVVMEGDAGDDSLNGGAGADELWGGAGADTMRGGTEGIQGNDFSDGQDGNDICLGDPGDSEVSCDD